MNSSFYNGISGIKSFQFGIDVWADNIANVNTTGFIGKTPEFSTIFSTALTNNYYDPTSNDIGLGSRASANALNTQTQGVFAPTDRAFDMAINGKGFFGVQSVGGEVFYTRAGSFYIDVDGNLVDESGNYLQGTLGENITPTTLSEEKLQQFGNYYTNIGTQETGTAYSISMLGDIALGEVTNQSSINLPDILYLPPEPTTYVNYQANLDPKIITETNYITSSNIENLLLSTTYPTTSISGSLANYTGISDLKAGDIITFTLLDETSNAVQIKATLDDNLEFSVSNIDISGIDNSGITLSDEVAILQEIANTEHFTTEIISPTGDKNIIDMTFTKQVPQQTTQTIWDVEIKLLNYVEDYQVLNYNPNTVYDESIYNVDEDAGQVTKIYDPNLYYIDTATKKVYEIIDTQNGNATFGGGGELIESNIPTLSNSGVTLDLSIGTPYEVQNIESGTYSEENGVLTVSGNTTTLQAGDVVSVDITDLNNITITLNATVREDGSWSATYENHILDTSSALTLNTYNVVSNGFDGMISHVDLDKARYSDADGHIEGLLSQYGMDSNGNIIAEFDNGRTSAIAKVAMYQFINEQGLTNITSTLFSASANSGEPMFYVNENGTYRGSSIKSYYLEGSNVNFATALTELIIMQKAFDASAKSITTSDQLIQNAINMKA